MRTNGLFYIQDVRPNEAFDEYGNPIAAKVGWKTPIECSIMTNTDTRKGVYEDGVFRQASYTILLEQSTFPCKKAEMVRLTRGGEYLGEFFVLSVESLPGVGRIKVVV